MTIHRLDLRRIVSDDELKPLKGSFLDDGWVLHYLDKDVDVFDKDTGVKVLSFRKRRLDSYHQINNFKKLAKASRGRGASAGPIDPESHYWKKRSLIKTKKFTTGYLKPDGTPSKMSVNNQVFSTTIGYFNEIKGLGGDLPCRLSHYTQQFFQEYQRSIPFIEDISRWYQHTWRDAYRYQMYRAKKTDFRIGETPFSTVTVNRNFRTGLHKDSGDFGGIACLTVLEHGNYHGGIFLLPAFGIGINLREGDILCANVHEYHANTELWTTPLQDEMNAQLEPLIQENKDVGTVGIGMDYSRISLVCYLREKMIDCSSGAGGSATTQ